MTLYTIVIIEQHDICINKKIIICPTNVFLVCIVMANIHTVNYYQLSRKSKPVLGISIASLLLPSS